MVQVVEEPSMEPINLARGWPNPAMLPVELLKQAAIDVLSTPSIAHDGLLYGPDPGYEPLRVAIAEWISQFYQPQTAIASDRICITGGASQNLGAMLNVYTDPAYTRHAWFVAPAYMLAFRVFEDAGFGDKMRAIPEDEEGIDLEYLRRELEKSEAEARRKKIDEPLYKPDRKRAKVYKHVIYCVPSFSNPSSKTMSLHHRQELVRLAREFDALVVADDVYDFLQWPAESQSPNFEAMQTAHLPRLVDIDRFLDRGEARTGADGFGNAVSNGSFSKIAGPGIRVGWVEGTEKFAYGVSQAGTTASGGAPSQLTSTYVTSLLTSGLLSHHIKTVLQPAYSARYVSFMQAIEKHLLPLGFTLPQTDRKIVGGYFVWLGLPARLSATALFRRCKMVNVIVAPGSRFEVPGDEAAVALDDHIRLCFTWVESNELVDAVQRIGRAAQDLIQRLEDGNVMIGDEDGAQQGADSYK